MTPLELLARLAALVPPPRHPLVRFHGAFAPRSSWRRHVVPKPPAQPPPKHEEHARAPKPVSPPPPQAAPPRQRTAPSAALALAPLSEPFTPNVLRITHWDRLKSGALLATSPRVDWPTLMRRTFDIDVLQCPKCTGRLRVLGIVDDEPLARQFVDELSLPRAPPTARARDPATLLATPDTDP